MAEIIDIICPTLEDCPVFQVDINSVDGFVAPTYSALAAKSLINGSGKRYFSKGDNFIFLSAGYMLPEQFTFSRGDEGSPYLRMELSPFGKDSAVRYYFQNMPASTLFPLESYENSIGTFFDCDKCTRLDRPADTLLLEDYFLTVYFTYVPDVTMLGVPSYFQGKRFRVVPFFKIKHSIEMT